MMTQILACTTRMLDGCKKFKMTGRLYLQALVPIGVLYSGSLVGSNLPFMTLSVAFIQMLKVIMPCLQLRGVVRIDKS